MSPSTPAVVTTAKPFWASRTLIVNAIVLALLVAESQLQVLQGVLPVSVYAIAAFALPVINTVLRVITTGPVTGGLPGRGQPSTTEGRQP